MIEESTNGIEFKHKQIKLDSNINGNNHKDMKNRKYVFNFLVQNLEDKIRLESDSSKLELNKIDKVIENAIHWCLVNGFVLVPKSRQQEDLMIVTYIPFTLFPTPFKRQQYKQVFDLQPKINDLVYKISNSFEFMEKAFKNLIGIDTFLNSLWTIYKKAKSNGYNQKINFSLLRVDYMLHQSDLNSNNVCMKQVEINTIAAGFSYVSTKASKLHKEILKWTNNTKLLDKIPLNEPVVKMAKGFVEAWKLYNVKSSICLFVVLDIEINIADQRHLEYEIISQEPNIEIHRCTLKDLNSFGYFDENTKTLYYQNKEVAIVYYRAGYDPSHYKSQIEWNVLYNIECSKAIKCPSLGTFLAGMKKVQEEISNEKNLNELCNYDSHLINMLKSVFAEFFLLDKQNNIDTVMKNPENYVLKPQREGGGHNIYNDKIKQILSKILESDNSIGMNGNSKNHTEKENIYNKDLYIVMEFLRPVISDNYIISSKKQQELFLSGKQKTLNKIQITNELGIYGVLVKNGDETILNEACGYCLRSKPAEDKEAGVMCGSGALDSIYFID